MLFMNVAVRALAMNFAGMTGKEVVTGLLKTWAVDALADMSAYTVGCVCDELGLPAGITFVAGLMTGCTVSVKAGKYVFEDAGGKIVKELDADGMWEYVGGVEYKGGTYSAFGEMSEADGIKYSNWMKVREGELYTDYIKAGEKLLEKLDIDGYKILKVEDAAIANADWFDMGFSKPPIAENTLAYTVEAGSHSYSRVYLEGYNNPVSVFIVRTDEIVGLSAQEIAEKLALSKVPNKIVDVKLPSSTPLEVSIVGPQPDWGTIGGDAQFAIKDIDLDPKWYTSIRNLD